jgi:DNA-binding NarL/FixJ family response regulator
MPNTIFLADDHAIVAQGVASLLQSLPLVAEVHIFSTGKRLYQELESKQPNIIILDIEMPEWSGIETLQHIKKKYDIPCMMLSMNDEKYIVQECLKHGANGYMSKDCTMQEFADALAVIIDGGTYIADSINKILISKKTMDNNVFELNAPITNRELEILAEICEGLTCKEIADKLYLSARTVETHKKSIMSKFGSHTTGKLVSLAIKHKYVK